MSDRASDRECPACGENLAADGNDCPACGNLKAPSSQEAARRWSVLRIAELTAFFAVSGATLAAIWFLTRRIL